MTEGEIARLPEPDDFRDAVWLANYGTWGPRDLEEVDALVYALVRKIKSTKVARG